MAKPAPKKATSGSKSVKYNPGKQVTTDKRAPVIGGAAVSQPSAAVPPMDQSLLSDDAWLNQDQTYLQTQAALSQALENYGNGADAKRTAYDIDNGNAVQQLGYQNGQWNRTDTNTQSGRAFNDQQNDFAARGMLQSSGYAQEDENLSRQLNGQLSQNANARTAYMTSINQDATAQADQTRTASNDAKMAALQRRASQYAATAGRLV